MAPNSMLPYKPKCTRVKSRGKKEESNIENYETNVTEPETTITEEKPLPESIVINNIDMSEHKQEEDQETIFQVSEVTPNQNEEQKPTEEKPNEPNVEQPERKGSFIDNILESMVEASKGGEESLRN